MVRFLGDFSLSALSLLLTNAVAWAQLSPAELSGRVTDQTGAVLPGATVTVTQTNTAIKHGFSYRRFAVGLIPVTRRFEAKLRY